MWPYIEYYHFVSVDERKAIFRVSGKQGLLTNTIAILGDMVIVLFSSQFELNWIASEGLAD